MTETVVPPLALLRFSALGDVASALRIAYEARRRWPQRRILFFSHSRFRPVADCLANTVEFVGLGEEVNGVNEMAALLRDLRAEVIDLHRSLRTTLLFAQTPHLRWRRLDKHRRQRRLLVKGQTEALPEAHRVQLDQAKLLDLELSDEPWLTAQGHSPSDVVLVPGAAWPEKRWPLESFSAVARQLSQGMRVVVLYSPYDDLPIENMDWGNATLEGELGLADCIGLLAATGVVLSNDTGFAHVAEGLGIPVRVFVGPTDQRLGAAPQSQFPEAKALHLGLDCQPCSQKGDKKCHVGGRPCLTGWDADQVVNEIRSLHAGVDAEAVREGYPHAHE